MNKTEVYGFIFLIVSSLFPLVWIVWAFLPDEYFHSVGVTYFPSKWWAVAVPTYLSTLFMMSTVVIFGLNLMNTKSLEDPRIVCDSSTAVREWPDGDGFDIPSAHDLPIELVNRLMYGIK